ncbi:MAG: methyltransferase [Chloroflexi bacterium]|nr:methyltransferase [Chloroflexota bacterium]
MAETLTPRQRFARIVAHQEADRVPLDLSGTSLTSADGRVIAGLGQLLGIDAPHMSDDESVDERILQALGIDFRRVGSLIGGKRWMAGERMVDIWGVERAWSGEYWDIVYSPLKDATLDDLDNYPWPDAAAIAAEAPLEQYGQRARALMADTDVVVVAEHPVYGVFELGCWMCGFDDMLWRMAGDKPFVIKLFGILLELQKAFIKPYYQALGSNIHLTTSGDDLGTQIGPFLSPASFRELIAPFFSERIAYTREFTPALFWHHTCGSVYDLLPDLIACGVRILNPIQPGAWKMEPERLKADYGTQLIFHGGFDTQNVLPFGSAEEIESEVSRMMRIMKAGGGYIFSAAHNIQHDVPSENVLSMFQAARRLGTYNNTEEAQ